MPDAVMDFVTGVIIGGLAMSACWGWFWLVITTVGFARSVCGIRVVMQSLVVSISPLLLGWGLWWMRSQAFSPETGFLFGLVTMPLILVGLGLRKASDGRPAGLHMAEAIRRLTDELQGAHHACGGHDHGVDAAERHT